MLPSYKENRRRGYYIALRRVDKAKELMRVLNEQKDNELCGIS